MFLIKDIMVCEVCQNSIQVIFCSQCQKGWCGTCDTQMNRCPYCRYIDPNNLNHMPTQPPVLIRQNATTS